MFTSLCSTLNEWAKNPLLVSIILPTFFFIFSVCVSILPNVRRKKIAFYSSRLHNNKINILFQNKSKYDLSKSDLVEDLKLKLESIGRIKDINIIKKGETKNLDISFSTKSLEISFDFFKAKSFFVVEVEIDDPEKSIIFTSDFKIKDGIYKRICYNDKCCNMFIGIHSVKDVFICLGKLLYYFGLFILAISFIYGFILFLFSPDLMENYRNQTPESFKLYWDIVGWIMRFLVPTCILGCYHLIYKSHMLKMIYRLSSFPVIIKHSEYFK